MVVHDSERSTYRSIKNCPHESVRECNSTFSWDFWFTQFDDTELCDEDIAWSDVEVHHVQTVKVAKTLQHLITEFRFVLIA